MGLYQDEFGLTELRFYTSAFIAWLGIIYFILAGTVLVGKRQPHNLEARAFDALPDVHGGLANLIRRYDINDYAASVYVYALKGR